MINLHKKGSLIKQTKDDQQEAATNAVKRIKYVRLFSLLPHKQGFTINTAHITNSLVGEIFAQERFVFQQNQTILLKDKQNQTRLLSKKTCLIFERTMI